MALIFRQARFGPLQDLTAEIPDGAIIGIVGEKGCGETPLLRLAAGLEIPESGEVIAEGTRRYLGPGESLNLSPVNVLAVNHTLAQSDALVRARALVALDRLRKGGATILVASHDTVLLRAICDEIWELDNGKLARRGAPDEVLEAYGQRISEKLRAWGDTLSTPITPTLRKGDGRGEIVTLEILGASGKPTAVLRSGEDATVRVVVKFNEAVQAPVIGMMIRTRIGLEVYGTNSELERAHVGPFDAGDTARIEFRFRCDLCPREYTLTAASHDPDGTAHDWMEDALSFQVTDARATAGVAKLQSIVTVTH